MLRRHAQEMSSARVKINVVIAILLVGVVGVVGVGFEGGVG